MNEQKTTNTDASENQALAALAAENDDLKKTLRLRDARESVTTTLASAGARSPSLIFDSVMDKLQFDASGAVQNAAAIVAMVKERYPEQFADPAEGPASIDAGSGRDQATRQLTREMLAGLSANEIAKLDWAEVRAALSE